MNPYLPRYPDNIIIHKGSNTVISCGWSLKDQVYKKISHCNFAALGNLYSVAGIEVLIRNLAHNYQITRLIHLAKSPLDRKVPTTDTLIDVWQGSNYPGVDGEILSAVTYRVQLFVVHSIDRLIDLLTVDRANDDGYLYPQLTYPLAENKVDRVIQMKYQNGLHFRGTMDQVWYKLLSTVYNKGVAMRGGHGGILDIGSVMSVFPMGATETVPDHLSREQLDQYALTLLVTDSGSEGSYTYGQRVGGQLQDVAKTLNQDPNSNRAVVGIWDPVYDLGNPNPPCLISIGYQIRLGRLYSRAVFRSHDIGSGWYPNAFALTRLAEVLLQGLEDKTLQLGEMTIISESAHVYQSALPQIAQILEDNKPQRLQLDPVGNFVLVVLEGGEVKIDYYPPDGSQRLTSYLDPRQALVDHPTMDTQHYGYLCSEFARAKLLGSHYRQDQK